MALASRNHKCRGGTGTAAQPVPATAAVLDIAVAALYLASPASSFVTGKVLEVDGGIEYPNLGLNLPDL